MSMMLFKELTLASAETLYMVVVSTVCSVILGLPLGTILFCSSSIKPMRKLKNYISSLINLSRSIPFIILLVTLIPLTRLIMGTSLGVHAMLVPLTLGATPFIARLINNVYQTLPEGLIETGFSLGTSTWQMIRYIIIPEALPGLIHATTVTAITLVNYSAMAGTIGGGGLGDFAIRYGYQRFDGLSMLITVTILVILVQLIQIGGDKLAAYFDKN
ncbi:MAG: methionine ABC transporter permease [Legionellales bacterium RIFCSPHIGHO2_12_FULL_42_9]|nr:MAG: methionine ABC transporter permease [Legionellales bacterium RIFCSPHIGHO2_12_FULL_42_9]